MKKVDIRLLRRGDMVKFGSEECTITFTNIKKVKRAENPRRKKFVFVEVG